MEKIDGHDRYIAEPVEPKPRVCECGRWTPVEAEKRDVRCLVCGRPCPRTRRLQAR